jgi:endo-1,4-beta-xylanase
MIYRQRLTRRQMIQLGLGAAAGIGAVSGSSKFSSSLLQSSAAGTNSSAALAGQPSLKSQAIAAGLLYGAAVDTQMLKRDPAFQAQFVRECQMLVPEWELKWDTMRPTPTTYDFAAGDWLVQFARSRGLLFRGHTLVWHWVPKWFEETVNPQNAERFLTDHITTVAKRYAGRVHSWDVVNEAIHPEDGQANGLRNNPWFQRMGENYIDLAFRVAAKADPKAYLVYNDFGLEYDNSVDEAKRTAVLKLLERLKSKNTPLHAFGMQSHLMGHETRFNPDKLRRFFADVASLGLKILITELDVVDQRLPKDIAIRDQMVAKAYEQYLEVALDEPAVTAVLSWGLSDRYSWLSKQNPRSDGAPVRPLLLDSDLNRKLAWGAVARSFKRSR